MGAGASKEEKSNNSSAVAGNGPAEADSGKSSFEITKEIFAKHVALFPSHTQVLSYTFNLFDISQTNSITPTDLQKFFEMVLDEAVTEAEIEKMIHTVTDGKSDEISYEQFEEFMRDDSDDLFRYKTFTMGSSVDASPGPSLDDASSPLEKTRGSGSASNLRASKHKNLLTSKSMNKKLTKSEQENENLRRAFDMFDFSERGQVSLSDLIDLMKMMGIDMSKEEVAALFGIVKRRKHIDYFEFVSLFKSG